MANLVGGNAGGNSGMSSGSIMPGKGLVNPAFKIKLVAATDKLQQPESPGRPAPADDYLDNLKVGDKVSFSTKEGKIEGRVERIIKNGEGDGVFVEVIDIDGKTHKVEGSRILAAVGDLDSDEEVATSSPAIFAENQKFLSYDQFNELSS